MRFGRKSKNSSIFRRIARPEPEDPAFSPVAAEEREALLAPEDDQPEASPHETDMVHTDDTSPLDASENAAHSLLAALGMYHREVTRAKDGQAGPHWTDACMNQLINGVEISLDNNWDDMAGALTETARILQTYDDANRSNDAIEFLDSVYDVLCLMGGNLLVGTLRSDVVERWRDQYAQAIAKLESDGLTLVVGDEERHMVRRNDTTAPATTPEPFDGVSDRPATDNADDDFPSVDAFAAEAAFIDDEEEENGGDIVGVTVPEEDEETSSEEDDDNTDAIAGVDAYEEDATAERPVAGDADDDVAQALDSLCTALSQWENDPEVDREDVYGAVRECLTFLRDIAERNGNFAAVGPCDALARLTQQARMHNHPDDKYFELAYAFCDAYVQAKGADTSPETISWIVECEALMIGMGTVPEEPEEEAEQSAAEVEAGDTGYVPPFPIAEDEPEAGAAAEVDSGDGDGDAEDAPDVIEIEPSPEVTSDASDVEVSQADLDALVNEVVAAEAARALDRGDEEEPVEEEAVEEAPVPVEPVDEFDAVPGEDEPKLDDAAAETPDLLPEQLDLDNDSPMRLLAIAQQAAAQGKVADARMLALTAAMRIATQESDDCEARLHDAEERLQAGSDAIVRAREAVTQTEERVTNAEETVREREAALKAQEESIGGIETHIGEVESTIADLDRQIAELQAKRTEEAERLAQRQGDLSEARDTRGDIEAELNQRRDEEEAARRALEDARQEVKASQNKRTEIEAERDRAREELESSRTNLKELDQTIGMFTGKFKIQPDPDGTQEDLLF